MKPKSMMGIASPTGSHLPVLEARARALAADVLVVEHGAGLYSTPLLARTGCRVLCCEPHQGWAEWARWIYQDKVEIVDSFKRVLERMRDVALIFVDGPARERGVLLQSAFDHRVPTIIAHDTQQGEWDHYGYQPHMFKPVDYDVSHSAEDSHRTTLWVLRA